MQEGKGGFASSLGVESFGVAFCLVASGEHQLYGSTPRAPEPMYGCVPTLGEAPSALPGLRKVQLIHHSLNGGRVLPSSLDASFTPSPVSQVQPIIEAESDLSGTGSGQLGSDGAGTPPHLEQRGRIWPHPGSLVWESLCCSLLGCSHQPLASLLESKQGGTRRKPALAWQAFEVPLWSSVDFCTPEEAMTFPPLSPEELMLLLGAREASICRQKPRGHNVCRPQPPPPRLVALEAAGRRRAGKPRDSATSAGVMEQRGRFLRPETPTSARKARLGSACSCCRSMRLSAVAAPARASRWRDAWQVAALMRSQ